jgi:SAM-dependent methyltransferase
MAYDVLAPEYDVWTGGYAYEPWFASFHGRARRLGLNGDRALDLACGTGKSTELLLGAGYRVQGCDISPGMIEVARRKLPEIADDLFVADMRALPDISEVDLVLCLEDAIIYVLAPEDLTEVFRGVRRALRPGGFVVFDVNSLATFRTTFAQTFVRKTDDHFFAWQGKADGDTETGGLAAAHIEAFARQPDGTWSRTTGLHEQRHHPIDVVTGALDAAGLRCCQVDGQKRGGILQSGPDELSHIKFVYYATRD